MEEDRKPSKEERPVRSSGLDCEECPTPHGICNDRGCAMCRSCPTWQRLIAPESTPQNTPHASVLSPVSPSNAPNPGVGVDEMGTPSQPRPYVPGDSDTRWLCPKCKAVTLRWIELSAHMRTCEAPLR